MKPFTSSIPHDSSAQAVISGKFSSVCHIITIACKTVTIRLTSHGEDVVYQGGTFKRASYSKGVPGFLVGEVSNSLGMEVQHASVTILHGTHCEASGGLSWGAFVESMGLDGSRILIEQLFLIDGVWAGIVVFDGIFGECKPLGLKTEITVDSITRVFDRPFPKNKISEKCIFTFGANGCGFNVASVTQSFTALAGSSRGEIITGITNRPDGYFSGGSISCEGPGGVIVRRRISASLASGAARVAIPFPWPTSGLAAMIRPACARTVDACNAWGNIQNYRGMPFVPRQEAAR